VFDVDEVGKARRFSWAMSGLDLEIVFGGPWIWQQ